MQPIDSILNNVTMYRLLVYSLGGLIALALLFCLLGTLPLSAGGLALTALGTMTGGLIADQALARLYRLPANYDSSLITALILTCILPQTTDVRSFIAVTLAAVLAVASKYLIVWRGQHIINPAAAGAILVGLAGLAHASWWIGSPVLFPFVLLAGLLILRKLRYWHLAGVFAGAAIVIMLLQGWRYGDAISTTLQTALLSGPLLFLAGFMLTEPSTMPSTRRWQWAFGALVGAMFASQLHIGHFGITPEIALATGNLAFFIARPKQRVQLRLKARHAYGHNLEDLEFVPSQPLRFKAGQYMEWTMGSVARDSRGNRRSFTIASAPQDASVHLGVRYYDRPSRFKERLRTLPLGSVISAGQISGDFVLPAHSNRKLLFIAGGVGITPFRSMVRELIADGKPRDIVLYYLVRDPSEIMYEETWKRAAKLGLRLIIVTPGQGKSFAELTARQLVKDVPDAVERLGYIAGPNVMVQSLRRMLRQAGLPNRAIITDYFSGY